MQLSNRELVVIKYFEKEYGNTIDIYFIPGSYGSYYLFNGDKSEEIGRLYFQSGGGSAISYNDTKNRDLITKMFSIRENETYRLFEKWLLLKFKCETVEDFRNKVDDEPLKKIPQIY
jgi:hypothetical protein